jgi:hypothetical protein
VPIVTPVPAGTSTVSAIVIDALYAASALGQDQQLPDSMAQIALRRLTRLINSLSNDPGFSCFATNTNSFVMTPTVATYSTTLLTNGRPQSIESMYVSLNNIDYAVTMRDEQWFNAITYKPTPAIPNNCYYNAGMPNGTFSFYPTPYAAFTCYVKRRDPLTFGVTPISLTTSLSLPPGYDKALVDCLAVDIFPTFKGTKTPIPQDLKDFAREAKRLLRLTNYEALEMSTPFENGGGNLSNTFPYRGF